MARRRSVLGEVGVSGTDDITAGDSRRRERPQNVRFRSEDEVHVVERQEDDEEGIIQETQRSGIHSQQRQLAVPSGSHSIMYKFAAALLLLGALASLLQSIGFTGHYGSLPIQGVDGVAIPEEAKSRPVLELERRGTSATKWCFKWAQQSAIVNGTLFLYGGEVAATSGQTQNTWTNDFVSIDLTKTWQTGSPTFSGLVQPSNVPAVALGYLWNSKESLFLYGGEFSWKPAVSPVPFSTWEYNVPNQQWVEHPNPMTSSGISAPDNGIAVQRAAEGAGVSVPSVGRGFYFGGHLDGYTTVGWDQSIPRVYLQSLLEFTFPGSSNSDVNALQGGQTAGADGVYRNITQGGIQNQGFTRRADGVLMFVPGFGAQGILVALAGGTNDTFTQMNVINVYDIATSSWYTQATSGSYPELRVNPCAVVAAAPDGSSYNIYMFGGQNLIPYDQQIQYDDMWILTLPSFQWIKVNQGGQSKPYARSGATCNIWDAQMIMVGGYLGPNPPLTCEYPATYIFNLSSLEWQTQFTALDPNIYGPTNELNQQPNQRYTGSSPGGLEGSYGYTVPDVIVSKVGGNGLGGATATTPVATATAGPFKTGSPIIYATGGSSPGGGGGYVAGGSSGSSGPNIAAIVVGVVCGVLFLIILYLLFCLFLYRKQLALYKRHVEMSQAQARGEKPPAIPGLWATDSRADDSDGTRKFLTPAETGSHAGSQPHSGTQTSLNTGVRNGYQSARRSSDESDTDDLLGGHEPTFVGVMLNPRRSLKIVNRD